MTEKTRNTRSAIEDLYPLTPLQQGLWFHELLDPAAGTYFVRNIIRIEGSLDRDAFRRAWEAVVARHAILRTRIVWEGLEHPLQLVQPRVALPWEERDWRDSPADEYQARLVEFLDADRVRGLDLAQAPLMRLTLLRVAEHSAILVWSLHHLILDRWSVDLVLQEVWSAYEALVEGRVPRFRSLRPYRDYLQWLKHQDLGRAEQFWRQLLRGFTVPTVLGIDQAPGTRAAHQEDSYDSEGVTLSEADTTRLSQWARQHKLTVNTLVQGAWSLLLSRYSGTDDVVFGATASGRSAGLSGIESMVGLFINTLPVRVHVSPGATLVEWLRALQEQQVTLREYEYTPLFEIQKWSDVPAGDPLFNTLLVFENTPLESGDDLTTKAAGLDVQPAAGAGGDQTTYPLVLIAVPGRSLRLYFRYDTRRYTAEAVTRVVGHLQKVLAAMVGATGQQRLGAIPLLTDAECQQLLVEWNATETAYPRDTTLAERFAAQAAATPDAVALVFEEQQLSYRELDARASCLAGYLQQHYGVDPEARVGLYLPRSVEMIVGVLGIIKAGGAYVPLDPNAPPGRLAFILEDADVTLVLTREDVREELPAGWSGPVIALDSEWPTIAETPAADLRRGATAESLAYIMYTSGSTGVPKGTSICQRSVMRLVMNTNYLEFGPSETFLQFAPLAFDASTLEIWGSLLHGSKLVVFPPHQASLEELARCLQEHEISTLWLTAAIFHQMVDSHPEALRGVRQLLSGGDVLSVSHVQRVLAHLPEGGRLINGYGPTENTTFTCCHVMTRESPVASTVPIGRPIANTQVYVLDSAMQPVPVGVYGELYIGGDGLARDYLKRPALTAEKFVPHPFSDTPGSRLYRTGDVVRYRSDGTVEFQGRRDHQVKLRGYRIELGEIEAVLGQHPEVRSTVALVREDQPGDKRLVGYIVPAQASVSVSDLRRYLRERVPDYMVPAHFVMLDGLPVTPNGKLDRRALPAPEGVRPELDAAYQTPRGPVEETLAEIWTEVLRIDQVGRRDNFFELGGHSLLATQVVARVRDGLGVELPLRALFEDSTVAELARRVATPREAKRRLAVPPLVPIPRDGPLELSFAQQRLWFLDQLEPEQCTFNVAWAVRLTGSLEVDALARALSAIVDRHEVLRTIFAADEDGEPVQVIAPADGVELEHVELGSLGPAERDSELQRQIGERANRPFDLSTGPMLRATLYRLSPEEHALALTIHHIAFDGWSFGVLARELGAFYAAFCEGREPALPALPIQYAGYAAWQRQWLQGEVLEAQIGYWRGQLGPELPVLELPTDHPRPAQQSFAGARESYTLPESLLTSLQSLSQREGVTMFMTLAAGLKVLFHRYSGQSVITIGTPVANRTRSAIEPLIGFFVNSLVLSTELEGELSFREALARVREVSLGAYAHQDLPFEQLVEALSPPRDLGRHPLFQVMFALQNAPFESMKLPGLRLSALPVERSNSQFDLTLSAQETDGGLALTARYNTELFERETIRRLLGHYETLLAGAVADPTRSISRLPLLSEDERRQLLFDWNATTTPHLHDVCIHDRFDDHARQTPDAVALVYEEDSLTYNALNMRANQVAHYLRRRGVAPEVRVGLCLDRSIEAIVAILGILKAGGAYVPLDPRFPRERLASMAQDADLHLILTDEKSQGRTSGLGVECICLNAARTAIDREKDSAPESQVSADSLAYVIFTSGSTGRPKGVEVEHRQLLNYVDGVLEQLRLPSGSGFAMVSPVTADLGHTMLYPALATGGTLHVISEERGLDTSALAAYFQLHRPDCLKIVPSHLAALLSGPNSAEVLPEKCLVVGGETCTWDLVEQVRSLRPQCRVINHYGPTETTVGVTTHPVEGSDPTPFRSPTVPIGRPLPNSQIYILDAHRDPVPRGVAGEVYIGGRNLARGYADAPELTAEKFVPHPYSHEPGARLYRTGDRARFRSGGTIEFLGRIDHQVKLRGFRVELGEIETALNQHRSVHAAVVAVREKEGGEKQLVAYVVPGQGPLSADDLRQFLSQTLPEYMVPTAFMMLEDLPLSPNGKVDRRQLPEPDDILTQSTKRFVLPRNPMEATLAQIWGSLLQLERVGVHDDFFELGGHSLLATRFVSRVRQEFDVDLPLRHFFNTPTIAELANGLEGLLWINAGRPDGDEADSQQREEGAV